MKRLLITSIALIALIGSACDTTRDGDNTRTTNGNANRDTTRETAGRDRGAKPPANITRDEFERTRSSWEKQARDLGRQVGSGADDLWIWVKTRSVLAYTDDLRDSTIEVDVEDNVVTLSGTVANNAQKQKALEAARNIEGVKSVVDRLVISAT